MIFSVFATLSYVLSDFNNDYKNFLFFNFRAVAPLTWSTEASLFYLQTDLSISLHHNAHNQNIKTKMHLATTQEYKSNQQQELYFFSISNYAAAAHFLACISLRNTLWIFQSLFWHSLEQYQVVPHCTVKKSERKRLNL
jgi:hypothetical protein